jgi:uncharacterized protein (DUF58 family)
VKTGKLLDEDFIQKIERLELVSKRLVSGALKGERLSKRKGRSTEFADFRPYVPGDDLRFLDWNVYARLDRLFLKLFLEEEDLRLGIVVDRSPSMEYGEPRKLDYAKRVAAALAYIGLIHQDRVQLSGFAREAKTLFGPARGRRQTSRLFATLEELEADDSTVTDLETSCRQLALARGGGGGGVTIFLSDFFDRAGFEGGLRYLSARGRSAEIFVFHVLAPQEIEPDLAGDLRLVDVEDGDVVEVSITAPLLRTYRKALDDFREGVKEFCARRGMHYVPAPTAVPFERLVLEYLRKTGLVR